jgi:hypothetical protein
VICEQATTFNRVLRDIFSRAFPSDPRIIKAKIDTSAGLKLRGLSAEVKRSIETGEPPEPKSVNDAVQLTEFVLGLHSKAHHPSVFREDRLTG